jgi:succinate-semialdehyde dehydrogenase/glutarate-semialdehyde dehydrogenase
VLVDPANGNELGTIPELGLDETKEAIQAAGEAFKTWGKTLAKVCRLCFHYTSCFQEHVDQA